ncbi:MAG: hypothetical protein AAGA54_31345 [Myxococcota bacterium]
MLAAPSGPRRNLAPVLLGLGPLAWKWPVVVGAVVAIWLLLLVLALLLARRFADPIIRIVVRPGHGPSSVDVQGSWPSPDAEAIAAYVAALELPPGSEIWARLAQGALEIRSNLRNPGPIEAAVGRFLAGGDPTGLQ